MRCPYCRHPDSRVVDSREHDEGQVIRRRRSCQDCGRRFTTVEEATLAVIKRSGVTEPFSRAKVRQRRAPRLPGPSGGRGPARPARADRRGRDPRAGRRRDPLRRGRAARSCRRCARSTRSPTCASPASTTPSARIEDFEKAIEDLRAEQPDSAADPATRARPTTHRRTTARRTTEPPYPVAKEGTTMTEAAAKHSTQQSDPLAVPHRRVAVPRERPARSSASTPRPACTRTPRSPGSAATSS